MWRTLQRIGGRHCIADSTLAFACMLHTWVSGTQRHHGIKEEWLNYAFEIHLHNGHWPSSSKQELKEPAPSTLPAPFSICLIPRAVCGRKGLNGLGMSKCKNPRDLHCPQTELYCNLCPKIFISKDKPHNRRETSGVIWPMAFCSIIN